MLTTLYIPAGRENQNTVAAVVSSIFVVILSSALFFFIGCISGWFGHKHKQSENGNASDKIQEFQAVPVCENLQPTSMPENQEKPLNLMII